MILPNKAIFSFAILYFLCPKSIHSDLKFHVSNEVCELPIISEVEIVHEAGLTDEQIAFLCHIKEFHKICVTFFWPRIISPLLLILLFIEVNTAIILIVIGAGTRLIVCMNNVCFSKPICEETSTI